MNEEQIKKVEDYVVKNTPDGIVVLNVKTLQNKAKDHKQPSYVTYVQLKQEKTGLEGTHSFNTLKIFRELKKKEKYDK